MQTSYLDYAMSVIMGRALPDVRDGLKPVHRRVLYAMSELGNTYRSPYKKSARVVGDVIGKYHPHGDAAAYETIVRMAQDFSMRYCTVDGQGNFGSVDGDSPAAQRYTEVRMTRIASDMLAGIDQETVDFVPNYDASEVEPTVLPTRVPTLLINGSAGIAVGMATNVPPHNIVEAINACLLVLYRPDCTIDEIMELLPAPDFPTGGIIYGLGGIREAYRTGRGKAIIRAKTEIEEIEGTDREAIIVKEIPYQVNKSQMLEKIAQLGSEKKIEGISFVRDESDKDGIRGVIELKRGANTEVVLNNLYKLTELESSFGINLVALVDGQPKLLNIKEIIEAFINHRWEVTTRAALFQLKTARSKIYLLEGQAVALANIDEFIEVIKTSANGAEAEERLLSRSWPSALVGELISRTKLEPKYFRPEGEDLTKGLQSDGTYYLTSAQAKNILQLRLQTLTGLEHERIEKDYAELAEEIHQLVTLLNNRDLMQQKIAADLREVQESYGDARRSEIVADAKDFKTKDLIPLREMVVTMTDTGYIKSQASAEYRAQKRGGQGRKATEVKEGDIISKLFVATTHDVLLCFTDKGRMFWLNVWDLPEGSSNSKGRPIVNLLELNDEKVSVVLPISDEDFQKDLYVFMATANGTVKKTPISDFKNQRKAGIIAVNLVEGDYLIGAAITDGVHDVMLFNDEGKAVRFAEEDVRSMGRTATGVRGMRLEGDSKVIAMLVAQEDDVTVLTVTENGYGKRTPINDYTRHGRGTKGMISIQTSERNGKVVSALLVNDNDEIILLNSAGKLVRTRVNEIRVMGRNTQGVRLISMDQGVTVIGVERVTENDDGSAEDETKQLEAE
ncbi:DNA gyrase subunit A, partial [Turicimonas muris]